jgi:hypothetical protein
MDYSVLQIKTKIISFHTADTKLVKQEVNGTMILPPLVFSAQLFTWPACLVLLPALFLPVTDALVLFSGFLRTNMS